MSTRRPLLERPGRCLRRLPRSLLPTALLALVPKCALCVLAYLGIGVLGLGGPELCGATANPDWHSKVWLFVGVVTASGVAILRRSRRQARPESGS